MALQIRITDGTTTVNLNTLPIICTDYPMASPEANEDVIKNLGDGDTLATPSWGNVTESLQLLITGASASAVRDSIQSIEKLLDKARQNRLTWRGVKVWIEVQFDQDSSVRWRSEILAGRLAHKKITDDIWRAKAESALIITRRYFWEGPETQLQLTSAGTGSPTTGYATIYNNDDASANTNWFQVDSAQVAGVIPAPLKLEFVNTSGSTRTLKSVHLGNYVHMDPTTIDPIFRADQAAYTDTTFGTGEETSYRWLLPQALLNDTVGQYCRILVALSSLPAATSLARARLQNPDGVVYTDIVVGEQVKVAGEAILDLGAMPIPPGGALVGSNAFTYLALSMQAASGSDTIGVDWIQVMPAGHGLYRQLRGVYPNAGLTNNSLLIDDGIEGQCYMVSGTDNYASYRGIHTPLHVWPGVTQRFRFMKQANGSLTPSEAFGVKAYYRQRRLTV